VASSFRTKPPHSKAALKTTGTYLMMCFSCVMLIAVFLRRHAAAGYQHQVASSTFSCNMSCCPLFFST
jgi:hypothetical protein